jgi:outer membrane protein assembly factor BamB
MKLNNKLSRLGLVQTIILSLILLVDNVNPGVCSPRASSQHISIANKSKSINSVKYDNEPRETWKVAIPKIRGLPTLTDDAVVVAFDHNIIALSRKTSEVLWSKDILDSVVEPNVIAHKAKHFQIFSPVLTSKILLVATSEELIGHVYGVDLHTGVIKWSYTCKKISPMDETHGMVLSRPVVFGTQAVFRTGRGLTALRTSDGKELWNRPFDPNGMVPVVLSGQPASDSHAIYFNSDFGVAYAIDPTDGHIIWSRQTAGLDIQRIANVSKINMTFTACHPLRIHDKLIVTDGVGNIYAKRASDGSAIWQTKVGLAFQLSSVGNRIYTGTENGFVEIDEASGKILRQYHIAHGVIGFAIKDDVAYLGAIPAGWEAFSLSQWKTREKFDTFQVSTLTIQLSRLYLSGYTGQSRETGELRAYDLVAKH